MSLLPRRVLLLVLALVAAYVGVWALFATGSWYRSFPGSGLRRLPVPGPYNAHLPKDVGALYLALAALSCCAARWAADGRLAVSTGLTWLVFSVPHLVFHLGHLDVYGLRDQVLNVVSLGFFAVAGAALLVPASGRREGGAPAPRSGRDPGAGSSN